jgi:tetratricopeptide (TPR) repeat protein
LFLNTFSRQFLVEQGLVRSRIDMSEAPQNAAYAAALHRAAQLHRAGKLLEAQAEYERLYAAAPDEPSLLNLLGTLRLQMGRPADALILLQRGTAARPTPASLNDLGEALRLNDRVAESLPVYRRALELAPNYHVSRVNLAMGLAQLGRYDEALATAQQVPAGVPEHFRARVAVAEVLERSGRADAAIAGWEAASRLEPNRPEVFNRLGIARGRSSDPAGAAQAFERALELAPDWPEARWNLAIALSKTSRTDEALANAQQAAERAPDRWEAFNALGIVHERVNRLTEAEAAFARAVQIKGDVAMTLGNLGNILDRQGRLDEARVYFERAQALAPEMIQVATALASVTLRNKAYQEAVALSDRAVTIGPNDPDAHGALSIALLATGQWDRGFAEYEWRWRCKNFDTPRRQFAQPMWDGSDPSGRTILVHSEQGFGDVLQFARYLPMLAAAGAKVLLECRAELRPLMKNVTGVSRTLTAGLVLPRFDLHVPMLSLPARFKTMRENIPAQVPYLRPDDDRVTAWREKLDEAIRGAIRGAIGASGRGRGGHRIGLVWGGSPKPDPRRTVGLPAMAPLAQIPNATFISLQKDDHAADARQPPAGMRLIDLTQEIRDFGETAALIANLDAVVAIDSAVAHLAGGLGAKTFVLLPYACDWRWVPEVATTSWYPTMRLFRQQTRAAWVDRDWSTPVIELMTELVATLNKGA